jgi:hypothetical protein
MVRVVIRTIAKIHLIPSTCVLVPIRLELTSAEMSNCVCRPIAMLTAYSSMVHLAK